MDEDSPHGELEGLLDWKMADLTHTLNLTGGFTELVFLMLVVELAWETWGRLGCTSIMQTMMHTACLMTMMRLQSLAQKSRVLSSIDLGTEQAISCAVLVRL